MTSAEYSLRNDGSDHDYIMTNYSGDDDNGDYNSVDDGNFESQLVPERFCAKKATANGP
jgi:hypothetical protein